jgi:hypothetical protein
VPLSSSSQSHCYRARDECSVSPSSSVFADCGRIILDQVLLVSLCFGPREDLGPEARVLGPVLGHVKKEWDARTGTVIYPLYAVFTVQYPQ